MTETLLQRAVAADAELIGFSGQHEVRSTGTDYLQPYVTLSHHLVQMHAAGWTGFDFDDVAALSGASALFGFQVDTFRPKYAHLHIDLEARIAAATGFGYEWLSFADTEEAWVLLTQAVDSGRTLKGQDWESILFAGYRAGSDVSCREVYAMADGPEYYSRWLAWDEFADWAQRVSDWGHRWLGRHTLRTQPRPERDIAVELLQNLVAWSTTPPDAVLAAFPGAAFGTAGIAAFASHLEAMGPDDDWVACHPVNPQWTIRNSTAVYLDRVVSRNVFPEAVNTQLSAAAAGYRACFECWQAAYALFGHATTSDARALPARRAALGAIVRAWQAHETDALGAARGALAAASSA